LLPSTYGQKRGKNMIEPAPRDVTSVSRRITRPQKERRADRECRPWHAPVYLSHRGRPDSTLIHWTGSRSGRQLVANSINRSSGLRALTSFSHAHESICQCLDCQSRRSRSCRRSRTRVDALFDLEPVRFLDQVIHLFPFYSIIRFVRKLVAPGPHPYLKIFSN